MDEKSIGVLGGTGPAGSAVAVRIAAAGYTVLLGSREATKAQAKVDELHARFPGRLGGLRGVDNATAAATDIAILATVADSIIPTATEHADVAGRSHRRLHGQPVAEDPARIRRGLPARRLRRRSGASRRAERRR